MKSIFTLLVIVFIYELGIKIIKGLISRIKAGRAEENYYIKRVQELEE